MKTPFLLPASVLALASLINLAAVPAQAHAAPARIAAAQHEHSEFDATLNAPYHGDGRGQPDARNFTLSFDYPGLQKRLGARWTLELLAPDGRVVQRWQGRTALSGRPRDVSVRWQGRTHGRPPASGVYHL